MESILDELYCGGYAPDIKPSPEARENGKKAAEMLDRVKAAFGLDFVNELGSCSAIITIDEHQQYFKEGFRLGARLMMEVLGATPAP